MQCWFAHRGVHSLRDLLQSPGRIARVYGAREQDVKHNAADWGRTAHGAARHRCTLQTQRNEGLSDSASV
eukprot:6434479-Prymnesium_polylepis.1